MTCRNQINRAIDRNKETARNPYDFTVAGKSNQLKCKFPAMFKGGMNLYFNRVIIHILHHSYLAQMSPSP